MLQFNPTVPQSHGPKAPSPDSAPGTGLAVLAVRRQTDVLFESAQLGRSVFEEHLYASQYSEAEATALWWRQRCLDIEAHSESVHGADRARAERIVEQCKVERSYLFEMRS